jgi:hypothetical protein
VACGGGRRWAQVACGVHAPGRGELATAACYSLPPGRVQALFRGLSGHAHLPCPAGLPLPLPFQAPTLSSASTGRAGWKVAISWSRHAPSTSHCSSQRAGGISWLLPRACVHVARVRGHVEGRGRGQRGRGQQGREPDATPGCASHPVQCSDGGPLGPGKGRAMQGTSSLPRRWRPGCRTCGRRCATPPHPPWPVAARMPMGPPRQQQQRRWIEEQGALPHGCPGSASAAAASGPCAPRRVGRGGRWWWAASARAAQPSPAPSLPWGGSGLVRARVLSSSSSSRRVETRAPFSGNTDYWRNRRNRGKERKERDGGGPPSQGWGRRVTLAL